MQTEYEYRALRVLVTVKSVKRLNLRVVADAPQVRVSMPTSMPLADVWRFVDSQYDWILGALDRVRKRCESQLDKEPPLTRAEALEFARKVYDRLNYWAGIMGVTYSHLAIRQMKSRWGSCSAQGRICINRRLAHYPSEWLDYVIVHELAHRVYLDHSPRFWAVVTRYYPNWRSIRSQMRTR